MQTEAVSGYMSGNWSNESHKYKKLKVIRPL